VNATVLLARLTKLGVSATADHGALRLRPASAIPTDLLAELREHKDDVLALLTSRMQEAEVSVALPALVSPAPPPLGEYRGRPVLAAADPTRAGSYLRGEASVVPLPVNDGPEPTPLPVPDDLVNRLAAVLGRPAPGQRVIDRETAMSYFVARARSILIPLDPPNRRLSVEAEDARAVVSPRRHPSAWHNHHEPAFTRIAAASRLGPWRPGRPS
jgi:hypothetical protein